MTSNYYRRKKEDKSSNRTKILIAIIGAVATIVAAIVGAQFFSGWLDNSESSETQISVRVSDDTGSSIGGAKVLLFFDSGSLEEYTDTSGIVNLNVNISQDVNARLIVETDQYEIYERELQLPHDKRVDVRLTERSVGTSSFIIRVVDDNDNYPILGAEILILVEGNVYSQITDSNGIVKLTIPVSGNQIDAQVSVNTENYEIKYQIVTLLPNKVQDIRLNSRKGIIAASTPPHSPTPTLLPTDTPDSAPVVEEPITEGSPLAYQVEIKNGSTQSGQGALTIQLFRGDATPMTGKRFRVYGQKQDLAGNWVVDGSSITYGDTDSTGAITFDLNPGSYILSSDFTGYNWGDAYDVKGIANLKIESGKITNVHIELARLVVGFLRADGTPIVGKRVRIYAQKKDLAGNWVVDGSSITYGDTDNTGAVIFNLAPGHYIVNSDFYGYNWGSAYDVMGIADFAVPSGQVTELIQYLGNITVGIVDNSGNPLQGKRVRVYFQKTDVNNNIIAGDNVTYGDTDNTGMISFNLTPGLYAVEVNDNYTYNVSVEAGHITLGNGDQFEVQP